MNEETKYLLIDHLGYAQDIFEQCIFNCNVAIKSSKANDKIKNELIHSIQIYQETIDEINSRIESLKSSSNVNLELLSDAIEALIHNGMTQKKSLSEIILPLFD